MKKNGFTLIEVLAVIFILGVLALISIPIVNRYIKNSREKVYESYIETIEAAANNMYVECVTDNYSDCIEPVRHSPVKITLNELIDKGYSDNLRVPNSTSTCDGNKSFVVVSNEDNSATNYEFVGCLFCGSYESTKEICLKNTESGAEVELVNAILECINFDKNTQTVLSYYSHRNNNTSNAVCPKNITVPDSISNVRVDHIADNAFNSRGMIGVVIPNTIKTIGVNAFANNNMNRFIVPSSVTSMGSNALGGINIVEVKKPSGSISGSPWGATQIVWQ